MIWLISKIKQSNHYLLVFRLFLFWLIIAIYKFYSFALQLRSRKKIAGNTKQVFGEKVNAIGYRETMTHTKT